MKNILKKILVISILVFTFSSCFFEEKQLFININKEELLQNSFKISGNINEDLKEDLDKIEVVWKNGVKNKSYLLNNFKKGDKSWFTDVNFEYGNIDYGENIYIFKGYIGKNIIGQTEFKINLEKNIENNTKKEEKKEIYNEVYENNIPIEWDNEELNEEMEYIKFLKNHYRDIENKNFKEAYSHYKNPKAKNLQIYSSWYKNINSIKLKNIKNIGDEEYSFYVLLEYNNNSLELYKTDMELSKINGNIKIIGYGSKKLKIEDYTNLLPENKKSDYIFNEQNLLNEGYKINNLGDIKEYYGFFMLNENNGYYRNQTIYKKGNKILNFGIVYAGGGPQIQIEFPYKVYIDLDKFISNDEIYSDNFGYNVGQPILGNYKYKIIVDSNLEMIKLVNNSKGINKILWER